MNDLKNILGKYFQIHEHLKLLSSQTREQRIPLQEQLAIAEEDILVFMETNQLDIVNFGDKKVELKTVNRKSPINKKNLLVLLTKYFQNTAEAEKCYTFLLDSVDTSSARVLRRGKKKKTPRTKESSTNKDNSNEFSGSESSQSSQSSESESENTH